MDDHKSFPDATFEYDSNYLTADIFHRASKVITTRYEGIFEPNSIQHHISAHLGCDFAKHANAVINYSIGRASRILDIGSGFGSFVLEALAGGREIVGVEISSTDSSIAKERIKACFPDQDPKLIFKTGNVFEQDFQKEIFDAVTLWNVIEHIDDYRVTLSYVKKILKPGGSVFIICPNYFTFRNEAHYQLPWTPFTSKERFIKKIRKAGLDPIFFEKEVFPINNLELIFFLYQIGFDVYDRLNQKKMLRPNFSLKRQNVNDLLCFFNPFKFSIELAARKRV